MYLCRVYDLNFMDKIYDEVAHDSEILSLTYSPEIDGEFCRVLCIVLSVFLARLTGNTVQRLLQMGIYILCTYYHKNIILHIDVIIQNVYF